MHYSCDYKTKTVDVTCEALDDEIQAMKEQDEDEHKNRCPAEPDKVTWGSKGHGGRQGT